MTCKVCSRPLLKVEEERGVCARDVRQGFNRLVGLLGLGSIGRR
jgi:hypothetical protein